LSEVTMASSSTSIVPSTSRTDIVFVFHAFILKNCWVNCAGMERVYFTRFYVDSTNTLTELCQLQHAPYSTFVQESYFAFGHHWCQIKTRCLICSIGRGNINYAGKQWPWICTWNHGHISVRDCPPQLLQFIIPSNELGHYSIVIYLFVTKYSIEDYVMRRFLVMKQLTKLVLYLGLHLASEHKI
jgi:hypothetical protein